MSSEYYEIYRKRLNRYGYDYQSRTQGERERYFDNLLLKSIYRLDFNYENKEQGIIEENIPGIFEPLKQNNTKTLHYLLTKIDFEMPNGTILMLYENNDKENLEPWMVYYKESIYASGYNRYIMLKMTHNVTWKARDGQEHTIQTYFYGQEDNMLKEELKSRSRSNVLYNEDLKLSFFVTPANGDIKKDDYFELGEGKFLQGYRVTGYDYVSTPGVEFVSVDPVYIYDKTSKPVPQPDENKDDYFWLEGGDN